jgi:glutamate-1-semialdehyde 2,1-aminomutase
MKSGNRAVITDVDGFSYIDFVNNYTSLVLGHCHPDVVEAVQRQIRLASAFAAPSELQNELAAIICARIASMEQLRFSNSGTEATLHAVRAARAYTNRPIIVTIGGGYHGSLHSIEVERLPSRKQSGFVMPQFAPDDDGLPPIVDGRIVVPINDHECVSRIFDKYSERLAGVMIEPLLGSGGCIPVHESYLHLLRTLTRDCGALLILDEVQTFRLDLGGMQTVLQVDPDLTCLGKVIGGGYPVGAFGGKADIMSMFSPDNGKHLGHSGTFNANPVTMAAGIATLKKLDKEAIDRINGMGERLQQELSSVALELGVEVQVTGIGSIMNLHPNSVKVTSPELAARDNKELLTCLHLALMQAGISIAPRGMFCVSTAMDKDEIERFILSFRETIEKLKPAIEIGAGELVRR